MDEAFAAAEGCRVEHHGEDVVRVGVGLAKARRGRREHLVDVAVSDAAAAPVGVGLEDVDSVADEPAVMNVDAVLGNFGVVRVAEQPLVHPHEVRHVQKVLDDTRRLGVQEVGSADERAKGVVPCLGVRRHLFARFLRRDPNETVRLRAPVTKRLRLGRNPHRFGLRRDVDTAPVPAVAPAVVGAHQRAVHHAPERKRRAPVDTEVAEGVNALSVTPQHERFAEHLDAHGLGPHVRRLRHRQPLTCEDRVDMGCCGRAL